MDNYLYDIFFDTFLSLITKKYGTSLSDQQRIDKAEEIIADFHKTNSYTVDMTQALINKKGFNHVTAKVIDGKPVFALTKEGLFKKVKVCYFCTRQKDVIDNDYLDLIYDELRKQAMGENIFNSPDYKNG